MYYVDYGDGTRFRDDNNEYFATERDAKNWADKYLWEYSIESYINEVVL